MKRGDMVGWKYRMEMNLPTEYGIIIDKLTLQHDPWPYWKVLFGKRGILQCRESDLKIIESQTYEKFNGLMIGLKQ